MSEITPAQIAAALEGIDDVNEVLNGWVDVSASNGSNVARVTFTPVRHEPGQDNVQHFRAVVVEGETEPVVLSSQAQAVYVVTDLTGALWLACGAPGCREPLTVVEDGKTLGELAAPWAAHVCPEAAQAEQERAQ